LKNPTQDPDHSRLARGCSRALLLLAIAGLLTDCGSDGSGGSKQTTGGAVACANGSAPAVLTWNAVADPNVAGYRIYYGTSPLVYSQSVDVGNVITTTVTALSSSTTYYFVATAYNTLNHESVISNEVCKAIS